MLLGFGYLYVCYVLPLFFQKAENNRSKKAKWPIFCNIIFLFLLKVQSVGLADQQTDYVLL